MLTSAPPIGNAERHAILARFSNNMPRNLAVLANSLNLRLASRCSERQFRGIRTTSLQLLWQIGKSGLRTGDVAAPCGITPQTAGVLASEMERLGYIRYQADHQDGRAKLLIQTPKGLRLLTCAEEEASALNQDLVRIVGAKSLADFRAACSQLYQPLIAHGASRSASLSSKMALPMILASLGVYCERRALSELDNPPGTRRLKLSFTHVLRFISPHGTFVTDLARLNNVSKQAISQTVTQIEQLGYVQRRANAADGRSSTIFLTNAGLQLIRESLDLIGKIEADFVAVLGRRAVNRFEKIAERLLAGTNGLSGMADTRDAITADAALRRATHMLYRDCDPSVRKQLFIRTGSTVKLSQTALRALDRLELHAPERPS